MDNIKIIYIIYKENVFLAHKLPCFFVNFIFNRQQMWDPSTILVHLRLVVFSFFIDDTAC